MKTVGEFMRAHRRLAGERRIDAWMQGRRFCSVQGDQSIANQAGAAFRSDLNNELLALVTLSSGASAPGTTYAHQLWADTSNNVLKKRNAANSAWIVVRTLDETFVLSRASNTILGVSDVGKTIIATAAFTQTLTAAATLGDGWFCAFNAQGNVVVIDPNGAETIDGSATKTVTGSGFIFCNGSNFFTVGFASSTTLALPQGRVTLTTGTAVTTTDVTGATTVYYTPFNGGQIPLYNGSGFDMTTFAEMSQATTDTTKSPAAVAASKVYDLFVWNDSGTKRCTRGPAWTSDTVRGTGAGTSELQQINGVWTNKVAITNGPGANFGTWVGTIGSDGSSQINDSKAKRHVWNTYNQVARQMLVNDATTSWTYSTAAFQQANANAANQLSYIQGAADHAVTAFVEHMAANTSATTLMGAGIGVDSTSVNSAINQYVSAPGVGYRFGLSARYTGSPGIGRHNLVWLEYSNGATGTFYGQLSPTNTGIAGEVQA